MNSLSEKIKEKKAGSTPTLFYLGQTGYALAGGGLCVVFDPYLTDSVDRICSDERATWTRNYAPPIAPDEVDFADLVLLSHDHLDHTDPETLVGIHRASPTAWFAASAGFADTLAEKGIPAYLIIPLEADAPTDFIRDGGSVKVTPIPAAHEELHPCTPGGYAEMGFVVEMLGRRIYHGGDTCLYDGLCERIAGVDAAIMPVNGRDAERAAIDVVGNMNAAEAAELANQAKVGLALPSHWDLYDNNGETEENIVAAFGAYPDVKYALPKPGASVEL